MTATQTNSSLDTNVLYVALELGQGKWKLAASVGFAQKPRIQDVAGGEVAMLLSKILAAKKRFGLPADSKVKCCYEAGRDGFWLHRFLLSQGIENVVVDSSSIEVQRRRRRAKSDRLDAGKLLTMLMRYAGGENRVWSVVTVPSDTDEDQRQLHRELKTLSVERTRQTNRIKGLLVGQGIRIEAIKCTFVKDLEEMCLWNGAPLPPNLKLRLQREFERLQLIDKQMRAIEEARSRELRNSSTEAVKKARRLMTLDGVGINTAWIYSMEIFAWRKIKNRRELGSLTGLTPTPYSSGDSEHEQGISKAGNCWIRSVAIELAWSWLTHQPLSALSGWYAKRFANGSSRQRKIGIVAVARKLIIALCRYLETGEVPQGATLSEWEKKVCCRRGTLCRAPT
jgi:transposase